jgi:hypothetical protein
MIQGRMACNSAKSFPGAGHSTGTDACSRCPTKISPAEFSAVATARPASMLRQRPRDTRSSHVIRKEVRIFPLLTLERKLSPHIEPTRAIGSKHGFTVQIRPVQYEFQRGGNEMLQIEYIKRPSFPG